MIVLAIDPGNEESAYLRYETESRKLLDFGKVPNDEIHAKLGRWRDTHSIVNGARGAGADHLAVEMIASYGMPVGREVFETCVWIGRYVECWSGPHTLVYRREVKLHLCGNNRAKDGNVRQALLDRFGGEKAKGTKKAPGPLYGVSADVWSALAIAVTWADLKAAFVVRDQQLARAAELEATA